MKILTIKNLFGLILCVLLLFIITTLVVESHTDEETVDYHHLNNQGQNILKSKSMPSNIIFGNHVIFKPVGYSEKQVENSIVFSSIDAIYTIFFGDSGQVTREFLEGINTEKELLYENLKMDFETKYMYVWDYPTTLDDDYILVMIGIDDLFIEGVFKETAASNYILEMFHIFNSIKYID